MTMDPKRLKGHEWCTDVLFFEKMKTQCIYMLSWLLGFNQFYYKTTVVDEYDICGICFCNPLTDHFVFSHKVVNRVREAQLQMSENSN